jgi:putative DNA primase/helicase
MQSSVSKSSFLGLSDKETARLTTFLVPIAIDLRPNVPVRDTGEVMRLGNKGSLKLERITGLWYDFEASRGGHGAATLIQYHLKEPGQARQYAVRWLTTHKGTGDCTGMVLNPAVVTERIERYAEFARQAVKRAAELGETSASALYLRSRGLPGPYPVNLLGHLEHSGRMGDSALLALLTDKTGETVGIQLGFIDYAGRKSVQIPDKQQYRIEPVESCGAAFRIAATSLPTDETERAALPAIVVELADHILIAEGVEDALSLHMAFPFSAILGVPGVGWIQHIEPLPKAKVIMVRDGDAPDSPADEALVTGQDHLLLNGASLWVTDTPAGKDANDLLQDGGIEVVQALLASRTVVQLSTRGTLYKLAGLSQFELEEVRRDEAERLGMRASVLDKEVAKLRKRLSARDELPNDGTQLGPDLWEESVADLGEVLDGIAVELARYIKASTEQLNTCALWCAATHLVHHPVIHLLVMARLAIQAIAPNSGKTTLLELLEPLVYHPMLAASLTAATTFRAVDQYSPTLLLDEAHKILKSRNNEELIGILNASHRRKSAVIPRMVPTPDGGWELRMFSVWMTYAFTGIGKLDDQLQSRSIAINLKRKLPHEVVERLEDGASEVLEMAGRKLARWAADLMELPVAINLPEMANREMDNWRVLLRIAAVAGGTWPARARTAALYAIGQSISVGDIVPLLADARDVLGKRDEIETREFLQLLIDLPEPRRDWAVVNRGRPINAYWLRKHLNEVLDPPETQGWHVGEGSTRRYCRGYRAAQFSDAFQRYLDGSSVTAAGAGSEASTPSTNRANGYNQEESAPGAEDVSLKRGPPSPSDRSNPSDPATNKAEQHQRLNSKSAVTPLSDPDPIQIRSKALETASHPIQEGPGSHAQAAGSTWIGSGLDLDQMDLFDRISVSGSKIHSNSIPGSDGLDRSDQEGGYKSRTATAPQPGVEEVSENSETLPSGKASGDNKFSDTEFWSMEDPQP